MAARDISVYTNCFQVLKAPSAMYYQFDNIQSLRQSDNQPPMSKRQRYEIMDRLQKAHADLFMPRPVFDGRKNLYSIKDIPSTEYPVYMGRPRAVGNHPKQEQKQEPTHKVTIRRVSIINPNTVNMLTRRRDSSDPNAVEMYTKSLTLLQLIVRQAPNIRHAFPADARSFYIREGAKDLRVGLSAWRGFFQSVRPALGKLIINVDVSHALVYTESDLITTMMNYLGLKDARALQNLPMASFQKLRAFLKGVVVSITVSKARPRPISDLVLAAGEVVFDDKSGQQWTVQQHFESKYKVPVKAPKCVGVRIGKTAIIPAEFCIVQPRQVYRKKISPQVQNDFLGFSKQRPDHRFNTISSAVAGDDFNYETSDYMKDAGMKVSPRPMELNGVVITPPSLLYGVNQQLKPRNGAWNMVGRQFYKSAEVQSWMVVNYSHADERTVRQFIDKLEGSLQRLGLALGGKPQIYGGQPANPMRILEERGREIQPKLVICILSHDAPEVRQAIKHWGDCRRSIATQCVRGGKWERADDQYCNNLALKINARLGGINSVIDDSGFRGLLGETMIIGADVGHPGPGVTNRPSITALVASLDPDASVTTCCSFVQQPRQEMIEDLEEMIFRFLGDWRDYRRKTFGPRADTPPKLIVFYRDGISEGEFERVVEYELPQIKSAFKRVGLVQDMWPKIVFITVAKRHHIRFFPKNPGDADRSGNCPAGLLISDNIVSPNYPNFYLQSHAGLLGTSRPAHYTILANEAGQSIRNLQQLTFYLCHLYVSSTRSVSIPAHVYYADRMCMRLPFFCGNGDGLADTASEFTTRTDPEPFDLEAWKLKANFQTPVALRHRMPFV